ncbi:MAG: LysM peptidoglycan-binding domain-containing protein, partial [Bdellovibrionales bacterium]
SLYSIAQRYKTSIEELKKLNRLSKGRLIRVGLKLRLPGDVIPENQTTERKDSSKRSVRKKYHVVKRGESLLQIAQRYQVPLSSIKNKNKIRNGSKILAGERILIPASSSR